MITKEYEWFGPYHGRFATSDGYIAIDTVDGEPIWADVYTFYTKGMSFRVYLNENGRLSVVAARSPKNMVSLDFERNATVGFIIQEADTTLLENCEFECINVDFERNDIYYNNTSATQETAEGIIALYVSAYLPSNYNIEGSCVKTGEGYMCHMRLA